MNFNNKILNDLISKDFKLAKSSCEKLINDNIFSAWEELTQKSEFIFDFIKEKINKNLANSINKNNFKNIFNFMKIYSEDFEDFILNSLLKFADEDLSDELLELLENGTISEKCWATLYFSHILDPLSLEIIENNLNSEDENLKYLTIKALKAHAATHKLEEAKEKLLSKDNETAYEGFQFIISWQDKNSFENLFEYLKNSDYKVPLSLDMAYFIGLEEVFKTYGYEKSNYIFGLLLDGIPEIIKPDEYILEEISNYFNLILSESKKENFALPILETKIKFDLMAENDSYTFDLEKNTKNKIKEIENQVKSITTKDMETYENSLGTYLNSNYAFEALEIIQEKELKIYAEEIKNLLDKTTNTALICKCTEILKDFQKLGEVNLEKILKNTHSDSAKALIESYFKED